MQRIILKVWYEMLPLRMKFLWKLLNFISNFFYLFYYVAILFKITYHRVFFFFFCRYDMSRYHHIHSFENALSLKFSSRFTVTCIDNKYVCNLKNNNNSYRHYLSRSVFCIIINFY